MKKLFIAFLALAVFALLSPGSTIAQEQEDIAVFSEETGIAPEPQKPKTLKERLKESRVEVGGTLRLRGAVYPRARYVKGAKYGKTYGEARLRPYLKYSPSSKWIVYIEGELRGDTAGFARGAMNDVAERSGRLWYANLRQGYVQYSKDKFSLIFGKKEYNWSVAETISPTDFFPRNWTDLLEWERIAVPGVNLRFGATTYIEAVGYMFTASKLPRGQFQRWLPAGLQEAWQNVPERHRANLAVRAGTNWKNTDFVVAAFHGYAMSPSVRFQPTSLFSADLVPQYNRQTVITASAVRELPKGVIGRFEIGHFWQKGPYDNFLQIVGNLQKEWTSVLKEGDRFFALLQYSDAVITRNKNRLPFKPLDFRQSLNGMPTLKLQWSPSQEMKWTLEVEGGYNVRNSDWIVRPSITYKIPKYNVEFKGGVDVFGGPKTSFFGGYRDASPRIYTMATWHF